MAKLSSGNIGQKGLTLLEVLVAVTIAGVVFVVLLSGFGVNLKSTAIAEDYTTASFLLKELMTDAELRKEIVTGKAEGDFGDRFPNFTWDSVTEKDSRLPFYRVTCRVNFVRSGTQREVAGTTILIEKRPGADTGQ